MCSLVFFLFKNLAKRHNKLNNFPGDKTYKIKCRVFSNVIDKVINIKVSFDIHTSITALAGRWR